MKRTLIELVVVGVLGTVVAFTANAVRGSGSLKMSKNYFATGTTPPEVNGSGTPTEVDTASTSENGQTPEHAKHPYQEVSVEEASDLFNDPKTSQGLIVFIDARNESNFEDGHIPGAVQCDPYQIGQYLYKIEVATNGVEKIIIYCGGGECEDSIFMCRELVEMGLPPEIVYLFAGGWEEWVDSDMPVEEGPEE
jgi:rhodanese-related sulfurtransferase